MLLSVEDLYVGETERRLGDRFREHLQDVKTKKNNKEVSIHFTQNGHSVNDMKVCVIAANSQGSMERKIKESYFINKLGCLYPCGMNRDKGFVK
jgi:hypothetical protein